MTEKRLNLPISKDIVRQLKLGDVVYLNGEFYTARDEAHHHALELINSGKKLPVSFSGSAVYHCGPIVRKIDNGWESLAAGPTTSARMNSMEPEFIEKTGVCAIIGKGGMNKATLDAMKKFGCVYLAITGGAAILAAKGMKVKGVEWIELGTPEALWILEGDNFGPLIVAMDAHGNSLYAELEARVQKNAESIRKKLGI